MASNIQAGTRGLSAGDWIRLQRLRGSRNFQSDKDQDITNPSPVLLETTQGARRIFTEFGTSKIRRPASFWTDYRASQTADYVLEAQNSETKSRSLDIQKVCRCQDAIFKTYDIDADIIYVTASIGDIKVGDIVYFTSLSSEGTIIKNNVQFYVVSVSAGTNVIIISISETQNGTPIDPVTDGVDVTGDETQLVVIGSRYSAIKHDPVCVKCIHS
jgi:hypothetical protein